MRCSSTVSAPVQHCCAPLTAHHSRYIAVQLLTNQVLYFIAETKSKTKDVYAQICIYLAGQGMLDCELFGLAIMCDGEYIFVDPESKLSKYAPKNWKSSSSHGLDGYGNPVFVLHFRVQFYVDTPILLRDDITRHNYYLQLRDNAISRGQVTYCSSDELLLLLAGYALQADYGDYNESEHKISYFQLEKYFPKELITRNSQIFKTAIALHKDNRGLSTAEAEMQYIKEASSNEITLLTHNLHLYKLKNHKKQEMDQSTVWLAICARGIQIYEETQFKKSLSTTFLWNNIGKLCFDRKKFEIKALSPSSEKLTYYTSSDEKSKHLLFLCRVTHQFSMSLQTRLSEAKKKEEEAKINRNSSQYKNLRSDQRISVISNTSSNTTSGIVSDRVQSLDESEDDLEIEIMINTPPGNSVESLALAHLKDAPLQEESSCELPSPVTGDAVNSALTSCHCNQKSSPSIGGPATPATTDGSQCSSSCSTVVIAEVGANSSSLSVSSFVKTQKNSPRRSSTTSSLELGYSHTAQNSVVSDSISCLELDLSVQNAQFGHSEKIDCDSSKEGYSFKSLPKSRADSKTSTFSFGKINKIRTSSNFQIESPGNEIETSRSSSLKNFSDYKRGLRSDTENTHNTEIEFSDRITTHVSNGSDLDTTSSGIYTNSNDLNSSRVYLSADLENGSSGIFTLPSTTEPDLQTNACSSETSGVYGIINSVADTSSTSECCGVYDVVEPMRERSESNASGVSASGSFHGDGSDPSEAGKGALLTAEELSDLIVGKTHNSGSYPSRATISNTLDSDSDYVTLPPPPRFPSRSNNDFDASGQLGDRPLSSFSKNLKQNYLDNGRQKQPVVSQNLLKKNKFLIQQEFKNGLEQHGEQNQQNCSTSLRQSPSSQQYSSSLTTLLAQMRPLSTMASPTEEANARFITTKPHISMITHSNLSSSSVTPNYASPTLSTFNYGETGRVQNDNVLYPNLSNNSTSNYLDQNSQLYHSNEGVSPNLNHPIPLPQRPFLNNIENCNNYCSNTFSVEPTPTKKYPTKNYQLDPGSKMKLNSLSLLPIVGKNNYLDIHASKAMNLMPVRSVAYHRAFSPLPPPTVIPRQPPPPPPLATVYTSQVTRSQIEQFKQQLYSDVDYVIYPMKDPAISKQEYIDAKQGSLLAAMANGYSHLYPPPPPYPCAKTHVVYRSAPNVAIGNSYLPVKITNQSVASKYSSSTHLNQSSDQLLGYQTYLPQPSHYSSTSPLYSTTSYSSSSSQSLRCEPSPLTDYLISHPLSSIPGNSLSFSRTRSDDNILNSYQNPSNIYSENIFRRFPPPPPPPPYKMRQPALPNPEYKAHKPTGLIKPKFKSDFNKFEVFNEPCKNVKTGEERKNIKTVSKDLKKEMSPSSSLKKTLMDDKGKIIDIHALIEKSKNLDLPLISALCNDKSLIRQTNAFVMPKHPGAGRCSSNHGLKSSKSASKKIGEKERPSSFHVESKNATSKSSKTQKIQDELSNSLTTVNDTAKTTKSATLLETLFSVKSSKNYSSSSKLKYPVSGLSTTQISKPQKKLSSAHVHPKDATKVGDGSVVGSVKTKLKTANAIKKKDPLVP